MFTINPAVEGGVLQVAVQVQLSTLHVYKAVWVELQNNIA